jgi:hypothetical protein
MAAREAYSLWGSAGGHVWAPADEDRRSDGIAPDEAWQPRAPHSRRWAFFSSLRDPEDLNGHR